MTEQILQLASGQRIGVLEAGDRSGVPVFYMHGFPSSRLEARLIEDQAIDAGVRLIALDRPGIGGSSPVRGFEIVHWPAIVAEVAAKMTIRHYGVMGFSAGAPFALACAARKPDQVAGCALLSPVAPPAVLANASTGGARVAWRILPVTPNLLLRLFLSFSLRRVARGGALEIADMLAQNAQRLGEGDRAVLQNAAVRQGFARAVAESYIQGPRANEDEAIALARPWGFDLSQIDLPVRIYHGTRDQIMPFGAAKILAGTMRHGTLFPQPEGHLSALVLRAAAALEALQAAIE